MANRINKIKVKSKQLDLCDVRLDASASTVTADMVEAANKDLSNLNNGVLGTGLIWENTNVSSTDTYYKVKLCNDKVIALKEGSNISISDDGITWSGITMDNIKSIKDIVYGYNANNNVDYYVAVGGYDTNNNQVFAWSINLSEWNIISLPAEGNWVSVSYIAISSSNNYFYAADNENGNLAYSEDGKTWELMQPSETTTTKYHWNSISSSNVSSKSETENYSNILIAGYGDDNKPYIAYTSNSVTVYNIKEVNIPDGLATDITQPSDVENLKIAQDTEYCAYMLNKTGFVASSADGDIYDYMVLPNLDKASYKWNSLAVGNGLIVVVNFDSLKNNIAYCYKDEQKWKIASNSMPIYCNDITYIGKATAKFIAVGKASDSSTCPIIYSNGEESNFAKNLNNIISKSQSNFQEIFYQENAPAEAKDGDYWFQILD